MEAVLLSVAATGGRLIMQKLAESFKERKFDITEWKNVDSSKIGTFMWRIKKFKVEKVPDEEFGVFYDGDTYLVLNTYKKDRVGKVIWDIYMWIGSDSTADEYGCAAYKMVELDETKFNGAARQHREQHGLESNKFQRLFPKMMVLKGGYESGFNKFEKYFEPKMYIVTGHKKNVKVVQVEYSYSKLTYEDVVIVDKGQEIYQLNGVDSNKDERIKAIQIVSQLKSARGKCSVEIIDNFDDKTSDPILVELKSMCKETTEQKPRHDATNKEEVFSLWKISNETGEFITSCIKKKKANLNDFDEKDVFLYYTLENLFVWVGSKSEKEEKMYVVCAAEEFLEVNRKKKVPIQMINQGDETKSFLRCLE